MKRRKDQPINTGRIQSLEAVTSLFVYYIDAYKLAGRFREVFVKFGG
jgi:hypothetical protein